MIRLATVEDAAAVAEITNHYIRTSTVTFYTEELSVDDRRKWLADRSARHPVFVAEEGGLIVGWASLSEHKARQAYQHTVESSVYIRPGYQRRGLGKALMHRVIAAATEAGFHTIVAGMCSEASDSYALHAALGFRQVAHFEQVGWKFGRWLDVIYTQMSLDSPGEKGELAATDNPDTAQPSREVLLKSDRNPPGV